MRIPGCALNWLRTVARPFVSSACPNRGRPYNTSGELLDYVVNKEAFDLERGCMRPFTLPGLGVVIDEARVIERSRAVTDWRNPVWRHGDGSVAEW
jgi:galactonate dehydratase